MTIIATIIVLGVLIFVHELGHFAAAKSVGIEVQRFSIGLGPRVWGFRRGETEYVLSAIPLGGYVKMGGMDDEVMERIEGGTGAEPRRPSARDFDAKPLWARAWVISAGVIMNMLFAFAAYTFVAAWWGFAHDETTRVGVVRAEALPPGAEALAGLQAGSRVARVGSTEVEHWGDVELGLFEAEPGPLTIETRDPAGVFEITVPPADDQEARFRLATALLSWTDPVVGVVMPGSAAERGGLEPGDRIVSVDGESVTTWWDFQAMIQERPETPTELTLEREGRPLVRNVTPQESVQPDPVTGEDRAVGAIGVRPPAVFERASLQESVAYGWNQTVGVTGMILAFLRDLVTGGVSPRSLGSIVTIGEASGQAAALGMDTFLQFMALFSVNLAVLNMLPIPVLDGGHLLFLAIEGIRGRALSVEQRLRWSNVGFLIVMGLMIWALGNDVLKLFGL